ncbi:hypothetical protein ACIBI4_15930 [Streptomyces sp. NPDC050418]|uniref:hypothetical protein n=1 Tax=Streptomyces sp. NPDC050418 TaxID=3365612 RepID=UPI00379187C2
MRTLLAALGVAAMALGAWLLLGVRDPLDVAVWLAGAIVLHDGLVAPLVLGTGLLLGGLRARGAVRGALIVAGSLTAVALPVILRPGTPANSSVLPLDYGRNWLAAMAVIGLFAVGAAVLGWVRGRRRRSSGE